MTFWTIQEYAESHTQQGEQTIHNWGTWVGQLSFEVFDCNANGTADAVDISAGTSQDCNANGRPDECEPDCNVNGIPDTCDIDAGTGDDCNENGVPDSCDLAAGTSCNFGGVPSECIFPDCDRDCTSDAAEIAGGAPDCDGDGTPDFCGGSDCNLNSLFDSCDIAVGTSADCDDNGVPDECQSDCDLDGTADACEPDCNENCRADDCDLNAGASLDCNDNGIPDECDPDCNLDHFPDDCDIAAGTSLDCNADGTPDECGPGYCDGTNHTCGTDCNLNDVRDALDIASGISQDNFGGAANGVPDECENGRPTACVTSAVTRKDHANHPDEDISLNLDGHVQDGNVTSEMRLGGITELRITFDMDLGTDGSVPGAITLFEQQRASCLAACPGGDQSGYEPYAGASNINSTAQGSTLIVNLTPGLESLATYRFRINTSVTRVASQALELRCLKADVNSDGAANAIDRSLVIAVWSGTGYSKQNGPEFGWNHKRAGPGRGYRCMDRSIRELRAMSAGLVAI